MYASTVSYERRKVIAPIYNYVNADLSIHLCIWVCNSIKVSNDYVTGVLNVFFLEINARVPNF